MKSLHDVIIEALPLEARARVRRIIKNNRRAVFLYTTDGWRFQVDRHVVGPNGLERRLTDQEIAAKFVRPLTFRAAAERVLETHGSTLKKLAKYDHMGD